MCWSDQHIFLTTKVWGVEISLFLPFHLVLCAFMFFSFCHIKQTSWTASCSHRRQQYRKWKSVHYAGHHTLLQSLGILLHLLWCLDFMSYEQMTQWALIWSFAWVDSDSTEGQGKPSLKRWLGEQMHPKLIAVCWPGPIIVLWICPSCWNKISMQQCVLHNTWVNAIQSTVILSFSSNICIFSEHHTQTNLPRPPPPHFMKNNRSPR